MSHDDDGEWVDGDGYPTEWGIGCLSGFHGTACEFVELIRKLWWVPTLITVESLLNDFGEPVMQVRLATGGWSGNEDVVAALNTTMFHLRYWESSHRGGLHIYEVPTRDWDAPSALGSWAGAST